MSIDISPDTQARLLATAQAEGMSIDAFLERLIDEREELAAAIERTEAHFGPVSREEIRDKIERGFQESERGEFADGDTFTSGLVSEMDEVERKRRVG
jgi:predicted transcriptional regulator